MEVRLGLPPEEMIAIFNQMYLEQWEKSKDKISWEAANISRRLKEGQEVDIGDLLLRVSEVVVTAARDGAILAIHYNNERVADDLRALGVELPASPQAASTGA